MLIRLLILFSLIFSLTFFISCKKKTTHNLTVKQDEDGIWRVMDEKDNNKGILTVFRGDTINWHFATSTAQMGFFKDLNRYFRFERGLFDETPADIIRRFDGSRRDLGQIFRESRSQFIEMEDTITLTVKDKAPADTLVYQIYIAEEDTFVVGDSPPMLDIQDL